MIEWIADALSGSEGYKRQFTVYIGPEELAKIQGSKMEALRREEFDCFIDYCRGKGR